MIDIRDITAAFNEANKTLETVDDLIPRILKLAKHRLRVTDRNPSAYSDHHDTLKALKRELKDYNIATGRWKK